MDSETPAAPANPRPGDRFALVVIVVTLFLALVPYLIGLSFAGERRFLWLGYNIDDAYVYLSWMRQGAEGSFRALNRFTIEPQQGMLLNPLFWAMGTMSRFTGIPLIGVFHAVRLAAGAGLLWLLWRFLCAATQREPLRRAALLFVCFASGLGWIPGLWEAPLEIIGGRPQGSIDKWQPEAVTFLSLYLNPLFIVSMALQVGVLYLLLQAERQSSLRKAVFAGVCGFLLALIHTYDILTVSAVWLLYLVVSRLRVSFDAQPPTPLRNALIQTTTAGLITLPGVAYIYWSLKTETVFQARANVETLSPPPQWLLLGYGLTLILALLGVYLLFKPRAAEEPALVPAVAKLLLAWLVGNLLIAYLPGVPFQRKMLQGAHIPIALLAGVGWTLLLQSRSRLALRYQTLATIGVTAILALSNLRFILRDIENFAANQTQTFQQRPYLQPGEIEALNWLATNAPKDAVIQPLPWIAFVTSGDGRRQTAVTDNSLACLVPGAIGRKVYCGHWGETPAFGEKLMELQRVALNNTPDEIRRDLLKKMQVNYLVFSQKAVEDSAADALVPQYRGVISPPAYLEPVHSNKDAVVFKVNL